MTNPPAFAVVDLPGVALAIDGDTVGSIAVIRSPNSAELREIEAAAARDDISAGLAAFYDLAGLTLDRVIAFPAAAREALDDAIFRVVAAAELRAAQAALAYRTDED